MSAPPVVTFSTAMRTRGPLGRAERQWRNFKTVLETGNDSV